MINLPGPQTREWRAANPSMVDPQDHEDQDHEEDPRNVTITLEVQDSVIGQHSEIKEGVDHGG